MRCFDCNKLPNKRHGAGIGSCDRCYQPTVVWLVGCGDDEVWPSRTNDGQRRRATDTADVDRRIL